MPEITHEKKDELTKHCLDFMGWYERWIVGVSMYHTYIDENSKEVAAAEDYSEPSGF